MRRNKAWQIVLGIVAVAALLAGAAAPARAADEDKWVTVTGSADGADERARDEAIAHALRLAVEEAGGVFLKGQSQAENYQLVYDRVMADTAGYVLDRTIQKVWTEGGKTFARIRARVAARKLQDDWSVIAFDLDRENNPRLIVGIVESVHQSTTGPIYQTDEAGIVQTKVEDFFLSKGVKLMDRETSAGVARRDILLAAIKDDTKEVAALGARFKADVVVVGRATAKFGKELKVENQTMYQYTATLNVRVVEADSALLLASKTFGPVTANTLQRAGGEDKVLAKLGEESAPPLLVAVVEAWRKRGKTIQISVSGMEFETWKPFREEVSKNRRIQALRLREITDSVANIDVECWRSYSNEALAEDLCRLESVKLAVTEVTAKRIKLTVVK